MYLIIFDCDGTLVDSQNMIVAAMDRAFAAHDRKAPPRDKILSIVGLSLDEAFQTLVDGEDDAPIGSLAENYKLAFQALRKDPAYREPLFDGARAAIEALHARDDVLLGIATGKARRGVDAILNMHGLNGRFSTIQTADDAPSKPHPGMIFQAMSETGVEPSRTVVVGDTSYDMAMARAARAHAIGVSWGYHPNGHLEAAGAHEIIDDFAELIPTIAGLVGWGAAA